MLQMQMMNQKVKRCEGRRALLLCPVDDATAGAPRGSVGRLLIRRQGPLCCVGASGMNGARPESERFRGRRQEGRK